MSEEESGAAPGERTAGNVCAVQRQPVLRDQGPRSHRHQGSQVHRPHRDASAPRTGRCHALRGLVSCCDSADFGTASDARPTRSERSSTRFPDDLAFALAQYLYSLEPPPNPNPGDARAAAGQQVFERERCDTCHTPPLYTNNKLTLGSRIHAAERSSARLRHHGDFRRHRSESRAEARARGPGFYKVPSLKGVWYRGLFNHDGSVASLEEWFDPARLQETTSCRQDSRDTK